MSRCKPRRFTKFFPALGGLLFVSFLSCGDDSPSGPCSSCADRLVEAAADSLGNILPGPIEFTPADVARWTTAHLLYEKALRENPDHVGANFGYALTALLILQSDEEVRSAFRSWGGFIGAHTPVPMIRGDYQPLGIPLSLHEGSGIDVFPFDLVPVTAATPVLACADPGALANLGSIEPVLRDRVVPALDDVLAHLEKVTHEPGFVFAVTPRMQGYPTAPNLEADRADFLLLWTGCNLLSSLSRILVSRELAFPDPDSTSLRHAIEPGGGWLRLGPQGMNHLDRAKADALRAAVGWKDALDVMLNETDTAQENDLVRIPMTQRSATVALRGAIDDLDARIVGLYGVTPNFDRDPETPDGTLTVSLSAAFQGRPVDWKDVLPAYSPRIHRDPFDVHDVSNDGFASYIITVPADGPYFGVYGFVHVDSLNFDEVTLTGDEALRPSLSQFVNARYRSVKSRPDWSGFYSGSAAVNATLEAGGDLTTVGWHEMYGVAGGFRPWPSLHWTAETFHDWELRDPDAGGLLPSIETTSDLVGLLGYDETKWRRDLVIRWASAGGKGDHAVSFPVQKHP